MFLFIGKSEKSAASMTLKSNWESIQSKKVDSVKKSIHESPESVDLNIDGVPMDEEDSN
jgi:hypothetical protein